MRPENDLGGAIAYLRGARAQAEVAERAGVEAGTWSQYEIGRRKPRAKDLSRILRGLGCTRAEFEELHLSFVRQRVLSASGSLGAAGLARPDAEAGGTDGAPAVPAHSAPPVPPAALRAELRAILSSLADPLAEALLLAVQAVVSKRPGPPSGR